VRTARPAFVGSWHRVDTAYEQQLLVLSEAGNVRLDSDIPGRWRAQGQTLELIIRTQFGFQQLTSRWRVDGDYLRLDVLSSRSKVDEDDAYQELDMDRSAQWQTWRFRRARWNNGDHSLPSMRSSAQQPLGWDGPRK
jgi:hypothetical protein